MTRRSKKGRGGYKLHYCEWCKQKKKEDVVACDECDKWFHLGCVNLASIDENESWFCPDCQLVRQQAEDNLNDAKPPGREELHPKKSQPKTQAKENSQPGTNSKANSQQSSVHTTVRSTENISVDYQNLKTPLSRTSAALSRITVSSNTAIMRQQIELARIEEERALERAYLDRKYSILLSNCRSGSASVATDRSSYTQSWVEQHKQTNLIWSNDDERQRFLQRLNEVRFDNTSPLTVPDENALNLEREICEESVAAGSHQINTDAKTFFNSKDGNYEFNKQPDSSIKISSRKVPASNFVKNLTAHQKTENLEKSKCETKSKRYTGPGNDDLSSNLVGLSMEQPSDDGMLTKRQIASRQVVKTDLPNFNGNPLSWPLYYSRYENSTKLCGYSKDENLDRLQRSLKGNARDAVESLLLSPDSVDDIIDTLKWMFGRPELIINALLAKLRELPAPKLDKLNTLVDFALNWDDTILNVQIVERWKLWLDILPLVEKVQIPRVYSLKMTPNIPQSIEYHIFVDASEKAFSAVAYLRVEDDNGVDCALVGSKARVAPLKYLSVPRLELQAGVLGSRLVTSIAASQTFVASRKVIWTDSLTLISWIRSDHRKYHQFVAHRIGEILDLTDIKDWRYVPSALNVADDATKWERVPSFDLTDRWFASPEFLKLDEKHWPNQPHFVDETEEEMKVHFAHTQFHIPILIDDKRFSNWKRMVRALAYVKRYASILWSKSHKKAIVQGHLTRDELLWSRQFLFKQAQHQHFPEEIVVLARNQILPESQQTQIKKSSFIYNLSPTLGDDGLLRVRGRLDAANIPYDTKRPVILPRNSRITRLLILDCHRTYNHQYSATVINELRQQVYIPSIRQLLKSVRANDCQRCKIRDAKPQPPEMGNLPFGRLAVGFRPFTFVGLDYFGPILVTEGRKTMKRWGVIFTCLTIRAIHIEIAHTINTDSCIMCVRNFIDLRGPPEEIFSDRGTNMVGMDNELLKRMVENLDKEKIASHFTTFYTKWNFNPPESPHMGGAWERLIGVVKNSLNAMETIHNPNDEMLRNMMMEAMNVVNSRPLTFIPIEHEEDEALTPNHFIHGTSSGIKSAVPYDMDGVELRSRWKECQRLADMFWSRFVKEYLPMIVRRTKWFDRVQPLAVGDIVLIIDEKNARNVYPRARVLDVIVSSNGQVHRVQVQRADKFIMWRSASGLAKLDVLADSSNGMADVNMDSHTGEGKVLQTPAIQTRILVLPPKGYSQAVP